MDKIKFKKKVVPNGSEWVDSEYYHGANTWVIHKSISAWTGLIVDVDTLETCLGSKDCVWMDKDASVIDEMINKAVENGRKFYITDVLHNVPGDKLFRRIFKDQAGNEVYINEVYVKQFDLDVVITDGNGGVCVRDDKLVGVMPYRF